MLISQFNIKKKTRVVESIEVTESGITFGPETGKETYPAGYASDGKMIMHVVIDLLPRIRDDQLTLDVMRAIEAIERGKPTQQQMQQVMDVYKAAEQAGIVQQYKDAIGSFVDQDEEDNEFKESEQEDGATQDEVASAIANRFMNDRDLLNKVLKDSDIGALTQAIDSVAEFHVGAQELGTSDVSGMVKEVMRELGINERKLSKPEQGVAEASWINGKKQDDSELVWKQTSMGYEQAVEKYGKEHVKKGGKNRRGEETVEVHVPLAEAGGLDNYRQRQAEKESIDESILKEYETAGYFTSAK